jgi:hypothetical protein
MPSAAATRTTRSVASGDRRSGFVPSEVSVIVAQVTESNEGADASGV